MKSTLKKSKNKTGCRGRGVCLSLGGDHVNVCASAWSPPRDRQTPRPRHPTGIVLLEVIIALTLFVVAAAVIGSVMISSMQATVDMQRSAQAVNIAQSILSEMEIGQVEIVDKSETACDDENKGWTYAITTEDVADDAPGLKKVTIAVTDPDSFRPHTYRLTQWILDPAALTEQTGETRP